MVRSVVESKTRNILGFHVLATLGRGARSVIYAVKDKDQNVYALKVVVRGDDNDQRYLEQTQIDHDVASKLDHPALRRSYRLIRQRKLIGSGEMAILMEFIDGQTLEEFPSRDVVQLCGIWRQVAQGLSAMHNAGLVHADIKPTNILVTDDGQVKVIDFGQSCEIGTIKPRIQGTPDYIAPEQVRREPITPQTDVFNLGATMYWMLTGRHVPTLIANSQEIGLKADDQCPPPRDVNPQVPPALSNLVMSCVQPQPRHRPETMERVYSRLEIAAHQVAQS